MFISALGFDTFKNIWLVKFCEAILSSYIFISFYSFERQTQASLQHGLHLKCLQQPGMGQTKQDLRTPFNRDPSPWAITCCLPGVHWWETGTEDRTGLRLRHSDMGCSIPRGIVTKAIMDINLKSFFSPLGCTKEICRKRIERLFWCKKRNPFASLSF